MASRKRKKKPFRESKVQPVRRGKYIPFAAAVLVAGVVVAVILFNLPGCGSKPAKDPAPAKPVAETSAKESQSPSSTAKPPAEATSPNSQPPAALSPDAVNTANQTAKAPDAKTGFDVLKGKWRRPDGGYVVDIKGVGAGGKMDASYANPRPIHVAEAKASQDGFAIKVFIELRDVNYPGSTYTLTYDPKSDELRGIYYQAALQQRFEVFFERIR